jgi:hypothetical protein
MKMKFCSLLVGASLFALAGAANAAEALSDNQMDRVTAGAAGFATGAADTTALGNLAAGTFTQVATEADGVQRFFGALSFTTGNATSVGIAAFSASTAQSAAACINCNL